MLLDSDRFLVGRAFLLFSPTRTTLLSLSSPFKRSVMCLIITSIATEKENAWIHNTQNGLTFTIQILQSLWFGAYFRHIKISDTILWKCRQKSFTVTDIYHERIQYVMGRGTFVGKAQSKPRGIQYDTWFSKKIIVTRLLPIYECLATDQTVMRCIGRADSCTHA